MLFQAVPICRHRILKSSQSLWLSSFIRREICLPRPLASVSFSRTTSYQPRPTSTFLRLSNRFRPSQAPLIQLPFTRPFSQQNGDSVSPPESIVLAPPAVGRWLLMSSVLVFAVIVVGGVTRLTESGLSITEWRPITGIIPPLTRNEWEEEFAKYQTTPEFKL